MSEPNEIGVCSEKSKWKWDCEMLGGEAGGYRSRRGRAVIGWVMDGPLHASHFVASISFSVLSLLMTMDMLWSRQRDAVGGCLQMVSERCSEGVLA